MSMTSPRLSFIVEHYDTMAQMVKKYQLFYYPEDASIEMFDIKNLRIFLKRIVNPEVKTSSLYIGSEITIYSRQYKIISFADEFTKKSLENIIIFEKNNYLCGGKYCVTKIDNNYLLIL